MSSRSQSQCPGSPSSRYAGGSEQPLRRRLGVDDAEHVVRRRGDVLRRRQAATFLHLQRT
nr:unnamed protein product [Digitaria exilis]